MTNRLMLGKRCRIGCSRSSGNKVGRIAAVICLVFTIGSARAGDIVTNRDDNDHGHFCSKTAVVLFKACRSEIKNDYLVAKAKCINVSCKENRKACFAKARGSLKEAAVLCREQFFGRLGVCGVIGEDRYDASFDPKEFDDPRNPTNPNPYFPLAVGNLWNYTEGDKSITVEVLDQTKFIEGVHCIVVRARDFEDGDLVEDTPDWYAQAKDGDVWYCGEEVKDYESFDGDDPRLPELVSTDGAFKVGRDGAKPGIQFRRFPIQGEIYRQEFSVANAEDVNEVLSTTYSFGNDSDLDRFVPPRLAQHFCSGNCVVTSDFSALEPGVIARKYYAPNIGLFLEVKPNSGEIVPLTDCNFDPRCEDLPTP